MARLASSFSAVLQLGLSLQLLVTTRACSVSRVTTVNIVQCGDRAHTTTTHHHTNMPSGFTTPAYEYFSDLVITEGLSLLLTISRFRFECQCNFTI